MTAAKKQLLLLSLPLILTAILRLPSPFEPYWYGDEGITLAVGQELNRGEKLYQDIADNKPPLLYFVAARAQTLYRFRLFTTVWVLLGLAGFVFLALRLFSPPSALLAAVILSLGLSLPLFEANISNGEIWFVPLTIGGMLLLYQKPRRRHLLLAGGFFGLAALFKLPAALDAAAALLFLAAAPGKKSLPRLRMFATGFTVPWILIVVWLAAQGSLSGFVREAIWNNILYTQNWGVDPFFPHSRLVAKFLFLALAALAIKKFASLSKKEKLIGLWLAFSLMGSLLSNRPYRHYALQLLPALALSAGFLLEAVRQKKLDPAAGLLILGGVLTAAFTGRFFQLNSGDFVNQYRYYDRFRTFVSDRNESVYMTGFDPQVPLLYRLAALTTRLTNPNQEIFIWGREWLVYSLANRGVAGKYAADFLINDVPNARTATTDYLKTHPPDLILLSEPRRYPLPGLAKMVAGHYHRFAQDNHVSLYQKI
jgi:hypothetical protein